MKVAARLRLLISAALRACSGTSDEPLVAAATRAGHPTLRRHIRARSDVPRAFVKVFACGQGVRDLAGRDTPPDDRETVMIVPSTAGG